MPKFQGMPKKAGRHKKSRFLGKITSQEPRNYCRITNTKAFASILQWEEEEEEEEEKGGEDG